MAVTYGFFNSMGGDRKYSAEQMSSIFDGVITDGVYASIGNKLTVAPGSGLQVLVRSGRAWFNHTWTLNDADYPLPLATPDKSLARIDAIVLEIDARNEARVNTFKVVQGTPNSNPAKPPLTNTDQIHQHVLGYVTVDANASSIATGKIENMVGTGTTPLVTSVLQQTNIDVLYNEWRGKFDEWFTNVQAQLAGNIATNLQKQIDTNKTSITNLQGTVTNNYNTLNGRFASYLPIASKANTAEAQAGIIDNKYITPLTLKNGITAMSGKTTLFNKNFVINSSDAWNATLSNPTNLQYDLLAIRFALSNIKCNYSGEANNSQTMKISVDGCLSVIIMYGHGYPTNITIKRTCIYQSISNLKNGSSNFSLYMYQGPGIFDYNSVINTSKGLYVYFGGNYAYSRLTGNLTITIFGINL